MVPKPNNSSSGTRSGSGALPRSMVANIMNANIEDPSQLRSEEGKITVGDWKTESTAKKPRSPPSGPGGSTSIDASGTTTTTTTSSSRSSYASDGNVQLDLDGRPINSGTGGGAAAGGMSARDRLVRVLSNHDAKVIDSDSDDDDDESVGSGFDAYDDLEDEENEFSTTLLNDLKDDGDEESTTEETPPPIHKDDADDDRSIDHQSLEKRSLDGRSLDDSGSVHNGNIQRKQNLFSIGSGATRWIQVLRLLTFLVIVGTAVMVSYAMWYVNQESQQSSFDAQYTAYSTQIIESFHVGIERQLAAFDGLSSGITSYALSSGQKFPNVLLPHWNVMSNIFQIQASATYVQYFPFIPDEDDRIMWEKFFTSNSGSFLPSVMQEAGLRAQQDVKFGYLDPMAPGQGQGSGQGPTTGAAPQDGGGQRQRDLQGGFDFSNIAHGTGFSPYIWSSVSNGPSNPNTGPYIPLAQFSPGLPIATPLNVNGGIEFAFYNGIARSVVQTGKASLGVMSPFTTESDENGNIIAMFNASLSLGPYRHTLSEFELDPVTFFGYPVYDDLYSPTKNVTGVLFSGVYWRAMFQDLLPSSALGIRVVVKNSLGQIETYQIDGAEVMYVGAGDQHDPAYDHMGMSASIVEYLQERASPLTQSYTSADLTDDYVSYELYVYPTSVTEEQYVNDNPLYFALAIAAVFLFMSAIFIIYNCLVEHRQRVVMDRAVKSSAVVQSLFPENVAQRLYEEQNKEQNATKTSTTDKNSTWRANTAAKRPSVSEYIAGDDSQELVSAALSVGDAPIADSFPDATVFFADLAGFTEWSSTRTPADVFGLLETIYSTFDRLAARRGVFKVETIGDCYVAVTGVPNAQEDHAILMAKFSFDCMVHLQKLLVRKLADRFGDDTRDLNLRIGLHSGAVTAGVLRGEKGRFQLFGDTVNTAARMESNGIPGRIQCSQATADILLTSGKSEWIEARTELVHAKGKGDMQTYWLKDSHKTRTLKSGRSMRSLGTLTSTAKSMTSSSSD